MPTVDEQGFADLNVYSWFAAFAPAGTPEPAVRRLQSAIATAMADPAIHAAFANQGWEPIASTPQYLDRWVKAEIDRWRNFVHASGLELR